MNGQPELRIESEAEYRRALKQAKARYRENLDRAVYEEELALAQEEHRARLMKA